MKESVTHNSEDQIPLSHKRNQRRRRCCFVLGVLLLLLILLFIVALVLALTVFKPKNPTIKIVSASLEGISPRVSFPPVQVQLNLTLNLTLQVHNPNPASFKHGQGKSLLFYKGKQIGETDIFPGLLPAKGSEIFASQLTLQLDRLASDITSLIRDIMDEGLTLESSTQIPGRVKFLGFIRKHAVAMSECQFTFDLPDRKIRSQSCKNKTKL